MRCFCNLLLIFLLSGCNINIRDRQAVHENVVLIFDNYEVKPFKTLGGSFNMNHTGITYIDPVTNDLVTFYPNSFRDTLILRCSSEFVEIGIAYRGFEKNYFPVYKGDSVRITVDEWDYPLLKSRNSSLEKVYNLNYYVRQGKTVQGLGCEIFLGDPSFNRIAHTIDVIKKNNWNMQRDYYCIDSLQQVFHSYYREYTDSLESYLRNKLLSDAVYQCLKYGLDLKKYHSQRTLAEDIEWVTAGLILSDSLIHYPSYHDYLKYYFHDVSKKDLPPIQKGQGNSVDCRIGFEQTEKDLSLPPLARNVLLKYYIEEIGEHFPGKDIQFYADKYLEISGDSVYYTEIIRRYNLLADENQLLLKDKNNRSVTWEHLLSNYKGKVVYVDFWASWCVPCREEIPASFVLHDELKNEEIVFVYLAYNDVEDSWRKTTQSLGLNRMKDSYWIENSKSSVFLRDLSLNLIPRYLIFDKNGELVEDNAPRPSSAEIRDLLKRYL